MPTGVVIEASVAVKWYVPEPGSIAAPGLLSTPGIRLAPDLPVAELGNTLMEKVRRTELRRGETWTTTRRVRMLSP